MRDGLTQIIINVEAQKDDPDEYDILNRAIFYVSRMVSSQKERDFVHQHYNDIKKVYSIWVCMNNKANTLNHRSSHMGRKTGFDKYHYDWLGG